MGVHEAEISMKFANGVPRMRNKIVCRKIADTSQTDPGTHTGTPHTPTGRKAVESATMALVLPLRLDKWLV